jgi:DNA repair exonuclease SbcCD ATPase subunit
MKGFIEVEYDNQIFTPVLETNGEDEIPDDLLARFNKASDEFEEIQAELEALHESHRKDRQNKMRLAIEKAKEKREADRSNFMKTFEEAVAQVIIIPKSAQEALEASHKLFQQQKKYADAINAVESSELIKAAVEEWTVAWNAGTNLDAVMKSILVTGFAIATEMHE